MVSRFRNELASRHVDGGFSGRWLVMGNRVLAVRGSAMRRSQDRLFGASREHGVLRTWFGEGSLQGASGRHTWVLGAALQQERFDLRELPEFDYRFTTPSVFGQDEMTFGPKWTLALSGRVDAHSEYGVLATPRVSLLARPAAGWVIRLSAGAGSFAPTPFTEETEETGLSRVKPLHDLRAERARGASFDVTRLAGPIEVTGTIFGSIVRWPVQERIAEDGMVELVNASESTRTGGAELLVRYRREGFVGLATYGWTRSTELDPDLAGTARRAPHARALGFAERHVGRNRLGTLRPRGLSHRASAARREPLSIDRPPRTVLVGALGERVFGRLRLFINAENLFDIRQTKYDPLILQTPRPDGRWTVDAWAPLDGRVINGGVRIAF